MILIMKTKKGEVVIQEEAGQIEEINKGLTLVYHQFMYLKYSM